MTDLTCQDFAEHAIQLKSTFSQRAIPPLQLKNNPSITSVTDAFIATVNKIGVSIQPDESAANYPDLNNRIFALHEMCHIHHDSEKARYYAVKVAESLAGFNLKY